MKTKKLYIGDCDVTITISGLTEQEINDVNAFSEDTLECDKYLIYMLAGNYRKGRQPCEGRRDRSAL